MAMACWGATARPPGSDRVATPMAPRSCTCECAHLHTCTCARARTPHPMHASSRTPSHNKNMHQVHEWLPGQAQPTHQFTCAVSNPSPQLSQHRALFARSAAATQPVDSTFELGLRTTWVPRCKAEGLAFPFHPVMRSLVPAQVPCFSFHAGACPGCSQAQAAAKPCSFE